MNVKQIRSQVAVLAVTVIAVMAALFAMATITSNAATSYDPETRTYTMTGGTYDQQIILEAGTTTTLDISGENVLSFGNDTYSNPCITGDGDLTITGSGTLEIPNGRVYCGILTVGDGIKLITSKYMYTYGGFNIGDGVELIIGNNLNVYGKATVGKAKILPGSPNAYLYFSNNSGTEGSVFNNTTIKATVSFYGEAFLNDCNVTLENRQLYSSGAPIHINGGTYNFIQDETNPSSNTGMSLGHRAVVKNATIKANTICYIQNLEMTDSTLEITLPKMEGGSYYGSTAALVGENLIFLNSKVKIDGCANVGLNAYWQVILTGNTEVDIKALETGIAATMVEITHSSGKIQATDSDKAVAAIAALNMGSGSNVTPGTLTLNKVYVKEPADYTIGEQVITPSGAPSGYEVPIKTILDGDVPAKTVVLEAEHKTHTWDAGKVTTEPTETAEGVKTYTCTVCGATKTEAIPKLTPQGSQDSQGSQGSQAASKGEDGTPFGKGASVTAAEAAILALPDDNDPAGTAFGLLQLKASKVTKNSINLKWKAVPGATKYILFANKCGTGNKYKKLGEVTGTSYTATQAAGAAIQKGTYYKFMMIAADANGKVVSTSKTVHAATKGGNIGNHKKVTVKKSVTKKAKKLKVGKTLKLKAKAVPQAKKLKVRKHRGIMYESSNPAVAQVNGKGAVKGVGKGTCYIYAYAQNGTCAKVKVTVK